MAATIGVCYSTNIIFKWLHFDFSEYAWVEMRSSSDVVTHTYGIKKQPTGQNTI